MKELRLEIAGLCIGISSKMMGFLHEFREQYQTYITSKIPHATIEVECNNKKEVALSKYFFGSLQKSNITVTNWYFAAQVNQQSKKVKLIVPEQNALMMLDQFLVLFYSWLCIQYNRILLHSATLVDKKRAYIFFGPSGAGKSTVAMNSRHLRLISDDLVVLKKLGDKFQIFSTPFHREQNGIEIQEPYIIHGLYRLIQDEDNYLEPLSKSEAISEIISNTWNLDKDVERYLKMIDIVHELVETVPVYRLHFLPDGSFWDIVNSGPSDKINMIN